MGDEEYQDNLSNNSSFEDKTEKSKVRKLSTVARALISARKLSDKSPTIQAEVK